MEYRTSTGVTLAVGRIHRSLIDAYATDNPPPEPPVNEVGVLGGVKEKVEDYNDPAYVRALFDYHVQMVTDEFSLIAQAVGVTRPEVWHSDERCHELREIGIDVTRVMDYLRYIALAEDEDRVAVTQLVMYQSTVTQRGIEEAERRFNIQWLNAPLSKHGGPPTRLRASAVFQARSAAREANYTWEQFCDLPGPQQSAIVAHYQAENKIAWLSSQVKN